MSEVPPSPSSTFSPQDLKVYGRLAVRWLWLVILCAVVAGLIAYLVSNFMTPIYQASSKVMINEARNPTAPNYNDILVSERVARTYADLMKRKSVLAETFTRLGLDPTLVKQQISGVSVTPVRDTQLVQISVEGPNRDIVVAVANTLPQVFLDELSKIQVSRFAESKVSMSDQLDTLSKQIETTQIQLSELENPRTSQDEVERNQLSNALMQYQTSYANLLKSYEELRLTEAESVDNIVMMEPATPPLGPIRPRTLFNTLIAIILGALVALGIIFLIEYLDDRVQTPEDLRRIADVPVLGAIGKSPTPKGVENTGLASIISLTQPRHPIVEAYRRLRTNLQFYNLDTGLRTIMVTSAEAGEGKSLTSANLAVVMAQSGLKVILVDADLRKPRQHAIFELPRTPGLAEALISGELTPDLLHPIERAPGLSVLTCGELMPNPAEVLGSQRMKHTLKQLTDAADIVIFDTPPLLAVTDAQIVGRMTDGALLVINAEHTSSGAVHRGLEALAQVSVPLMGVVLNRLSNSGRSYYYYYYYHSRDYYGDGPKGKQNGKATAGDLAQSTAPEKQPST